MLRRHPALRWLVPLGVAGVIGLTATGVVGSSASSRSSLPDTTPAALIAAVRDSAVAGFSGTVVSHFSLGLPELPALSGTDSEATSLLALLAGSHTMQVWYGGPDKQRIALLGSTEETDIFRKGTELWQWSSADHVAVHTVLPPVLQRPGRAAPAVPPVARLTPMQIAESAVAALDPSTHVVVEAGHEVADRSAYDLILTPRAAATKVGSVRVSVDGQTKLPLAVEIFARGADTPAVDVAFTNIVFGRQADRNFRFSPPPGATVRNSADGRPAPPAERIEAQDVPSATVRPTVSGSGWTSVLTVRPSTSPVQSLHSSPLMNATKRVDGSWGSGYLLDSELMSALITDDGRVLVGAVTPSELFVAAGRK
jgi:outer membrane lipoprotein-sorting protein